MNIKKGDNVIMRTGSDKGKKGVVLKVFREAGTAVVEGVSIHKVHKKKTGNKGGAIIEMPTPVRLSNLSLIDPKDGKPTRIGHKIINGKKVRIAPRSEMEIR